MSENTVNELTKEPAADTKKLDFILDIPLHVTVELGRTKLLVSGKGVNARVSGGYLEVSVPEVLDHEVIAVDLA